MLHRGGTVNTGETATKRKRHAQNQVSKADGEFTWEGEVQVLHARATVEGREERARTGMGRGESKRAAV